MSIVKPQPLRRHLIHVDRSPCRIGIVTGHVANPQIVRQDVDDVWPQRLRRRCAEVRAANRIAGKQIASRAVSRQRDIA